MPPQKVAWVHNPSAEDAEIETMDSITKTGLQGMLTGLDNAARDASRVVNSFSDKSTEDPIAPLVDLKKDSFQVQASAKVIKVGDEMLGSILDILG